MLKIFNNLAPFFEDCYRTIHVREYAKLIGVSPPTASKMLDKFRLKGLLTLTTDKNYLYYKANRENTVFIKLSQIYWTEKLVNSGLVTFIEKHCLYPVIVLFGSLAKGEVTPESDIDIAVFSPEKKEICLDGFEKKIGREIQLFQFLSREKVASPYLLNNILNGCNISGMW